MSGAIIFVAGCILSFVLIWALRYVPAARAFVDSPAKPQAMHSQAVPRYGGLGIVGAFVLVAATALWLRPLTLPSWCLPLGSALALVGAISIIDDLRHVPAWLRLCVHSIAAVVVVSALWLSAQSYGAVQLGSCAGLVVAAACVLGIAWSVNLFNFMDGVNGMVGVASAVGLLGLALLASMNSAASAAYLGATPSALTMLCIAAAGAATGFLPHNLSGRVFMGDLGSTGLGLLTASLALIGVIEAQWDWWVPLVVFAPLIVDSTWTLICRAVKGERVWESHREHIYQRLVRHMQWSHLQVAALYGALTCVGVIAVAVSRHFAPPDGGVFPMLAAAWVLKYVSLVVFAEVYFRKAR